MKNSKKVEKVNQRRNKMEENREREKLEKRKRAIKIQIREAKREQAYIERRWQKNCFRYFIAFLRVNKNIIKELYFQMIEWNRLENKRKVLIKQLKQIRD